MVTKITYTHEETKNNIELYQHKDVELKLEYTPEQALAHVILSTMLSTEVFPGATKVFVTIKEFHEKVQEGLNKIEQVYTKE